MQKFLDDDFLLFTKKAQTLYHETAEKLPIIDYHCHVSPAEIANDVKATNISELWLGGDHYKWRCMRSCGIDEKFITGDASDYEKFREFARIMPRLCGNPMYHWSHLELKRYFGFDKVLSEKTCDEAWQATSQRLAADDSLSVKNIIRSSKVRLLCTTDDPCDDLADHKRIAEDDTFDTKVLPAFRPDKIINCERVDYRTYIEKLARVCGEKITDLASLLACCEKRIDYFDSLGCKTADHGIDTRVLYAKQKSQKQIDDIFKKAFVTDKPDITDEEQALFKTYMHRYFASKYREKGWIWQLHFGVLRNVNARTFALLGPDSGFDTAGNDTGIEALAMLLSSIENGGGLPRCILYSINPSDNAAVGALIGSFQKGDGSGIPLMAQGSAWWFNDNEDGMRAQIASLANLGALGHFPGMLTDSRSFLSYTRHEYFRRILCDVIGGWVESGRLPDDDEYLNTLITDICFENANKLFGFDLKI